LWIIFCWEDASKTGVEEGGCGVDVDMLARIDRDLYSCGLVLSRLHFGPQFVVELESCAVVMDW
jgi:hypothetical protein